MRKGLQGIASCAVRPRRYSVGNGVIRRWAFWKSDWGPPVGTTHIIIEAVVTKHGDAPTAKPQDEKGQGNEIHGWV